VPDTRHFCELAEALLDFADDFVSRVKAVFGDVFPDRKQIGPRFRRDQKPAHARSLRR
jgi:hypothetical protein